MRLRDFAPADQEQVRTLVLAGLAGHWGSMDQALNLDLHDIADSYGAGRTVVVENLEALLDTARRWGKTTVVLETSAHWDEVVAFYVACGLHVTHQTDGDFGRDSWFELRARRLRPV